MKKNYVLLTATICTVSILASCSKQDALIPPPHIKTFQQGFADTPYLKNNAVFVDTPYLKHLIVSTVVADTPYLKTTVVSSVVADTPYLHHNIPAKPGK